MMVLSGRTRDSRLGAALRTAAAEEGDPRQRLSPTRLSPNRPSPPGNRFTLTPSCRGNGRSYLSRFSETGTALRNRGLRSHEVRSWSSTTGGERWRSVSRRLLDALDVFYLKRSPTSPLHSPSLREGRSHPTLSVEVPQSFNHRADRSPRVRRRGVDSSVSRIVPRERLLRSTRRT